MFFPQFAPACGERVGFWCYDELLGWFHAPGGQGRFVHRDFSIDVNINSLGLRDTEYPLERTGGRKRMLIMGDSFGWGFGVSCDERFSEILERSHQDWEVINASVSGYGTDQQFLYLREFGLSLKPDVVLLVFSGNDFRDNVSNERSGYYKPCFTLECDTLRLENTPVPKSTLKQKIDRFFFGRTYVLGRAYYYGLVAWDKTEGLFTAGHRVSGGRDRMRQRRGRYKVTDRLISAMGEIVGKNDAEFVVVSVPMDEEERVFLEELCLREGIPYLPLDTFFSETEIELTLPHDRHWNPAGHEVAAVAIDRFLRDLNVF